MSRLLFDISRARRWRQSIALMALVWISGSSVCRGQDVPATRWVTSVYECVIDGRHVFSDQPCGANAQQREIAESNRMEAQDTRILQQHEPKPTRRHDDDADDTQRLRDACNRIREQVDDIRARMRIGYSAAQGNRYEERLRKLDERYRKQRCERYR